jgi:hypothetical protein
MGGVSLSEHWLKKLSANNLIELTPLSAFKYFWFILISPSCEQYKHTVPCLGPGIKGTPRGCFEILT